MLPLIVGGGLASLVGIWSMRDTFDDIANIAKWATIGGVVYIVVTKTNALKFLNKRLK